MKTIKFLFGTLAALMMMVGCDELGGLLGDGLKELELSKTSIEFEAEAGSQTVEITAPLAWEVKCSASWITVTPDKGEASTEKVKVTIAVAENTGEAREADVEFVIEETGKTVKVTQKAAEKPDTPVTPGEEMKGWGIVGDLNGWGLNADGSKRPDIPMNVDESGKFLVAYKVVFPEGRFKLRQNEEWLETNGNVGLYQMEGLLEVDHVYDVVNSWDDAGNMYIVAGTYDVWFDLANLKIYMMTAGKAISEAVAGTFGEIPGTPDVPDEPEGTWGIVGEVNGWGATEDIPMELLKDSIFVAKNVELPEGGFKIRKNNEWNDAANLGLAAQGPVEADHYYPLVCGGGSANMMAAAGTYDIYLDEKAMLIYVMTPGKDYTEATAPGDTPVDPVDPTVWYVAGEFNNWTAGDENYKMTPGDEYYSFIGLSLNSETQFKFTLPNWTEDRGAEQTVLNEAVQVVQGGNNLVVPAGTYDLYLSKDLNTAYIMNSGLLPGEKPEVPAELVVDVTGIALPAEGGEIKVGVTATHDWKASTHADWLAITPQSGAGSADKQIVIVTSLSNTTPVERAAEILFEMAGIQKVVTVRQEGVGTVDPGVDMKNWGVVGDFNNWGVNGEDVPMEVDATGKYLVAYKVTIDKGDFKIRQNKSWEEGNGNVGLETMGSVAPDHVYDIVNSYHAANIQVPAGTYDLWLDLVNLKLYVMAAGKEITEAVAGTPGEYVYPDNPDNPDQPVQPEYTWYLVGSFNGWSSPDENYRMTEEGNFYVFKGLSVSDYTEFKFNIGSWDVNRGGDFYEINNGFEVWDGGNNICIPAGVYDVYLRKDAARAYIMEPGKTPQDNSAGLGTEDFTKGDIVEW